MNSPEEASPPTAPPVIAGPPPKLEDTASLSPGRKFLAIVLSLFLGLFLIAALVSVLDDSCVLFLGNHFLTLLSGILSIVTLLAALLVYLLMGLTPMIPARIFLPVIFLIASALLIMLPATIYCYDRLLQIDCLIAGSEVVLGLAILRWLHGRWIIHWPLIPENRLGKQAFSWLNVLAFILVNIFAVLPFMAAYLGGCASLAVSHFTDGFMSLRPSGLIVQARKYVRDDGKTVLLFPMAHIADATFYGNVMQSVTSNSVVLLEGITDRSNLLTHGISYRRAAEKLHLSEQHDEFDLDHGELVHADVDVSDFSSNTLSLLNLVALIHRDGLNEHTLSQLSSCSPTPEMEQQLITDILFNRNRHVLGVLHERLADSDHFVIPWGAAHMPGLAREILKSGFHLAETHEYPVIRFGGKESVKTVRPEKPPAR